MSKTFDLTLLPLYRLRGNELPSPPGLLVLAPPRRKARSREKDRLVVHLTLAGNAPFSTVNYLQMTSRAAEEFYQTPGSVTAALRMAASTLNGDLLERNMASSGQGRYSTGQLTLGALRGEQFYILEAGPTHAYWMADSERIHIHDIALAGRGLGMGQATQTYLSQITIRAGGRLLLTPKFPSIWEQILQRDNHTAPLEILRNALMRQSSEDENAVLIEVSEGRGAVTVLKPERGTKPTLESISERISAEPKIPERAPRASHHHQPEPLPVDTHETEDAPLPAPREDNESKPPLVRPVVPDSIPRRAPEPTPAPAEDIHFEPESEEDIIPAGPSTSEVFARQSARALAKGMQATRAGNERLKAGVQKVLPRLLPRDDSETPVRLPGWVMGLIAIIIPLVVVTIASVVYFRFGRDFQYDTLYAQAEAARARAIGQDDPIAARIAWEDTISELEKAEAFDITSDTRALRSEAQNHLDELLGILRLEFKPAISGLPRGISISRIAATDNELFMLDENSGEILRAFLVGNGYQYDDTFLCKSGEYGGKNVGALIELLALPKANAMAASVLGVDQQGNLLYCADNQVPQALSLQQPTVGFREVTAVIIDSDVLYLLDAASREVWVYGGQASTFINYPTAFFEQAPEGLENAIDMSVTGSDLYLLFTDGHLASCTYSLLNTVPTRCINPAQLIDPHPAAGGGSSFGQVIFTEMHLSTPPDAAILLLASEAQAVFRLSPRSYELQNQLHAYNNDEANSIPRSALTAVTTNANHILFIAQTDQVYMAVDTP
ncbi:MAG: hypothetical protein HN855_09415 [Anaerolineae bacterium]|nr:hypothetical protein [Anaerolineae bacterium]MBT7069401.1 hypothetical protein [Anaerolineae bacterium]MBT7325365.1 hypothetical protein [Anaerolineae bacterium]